MFRVSLVVAFAAVAVFAREPAQPKAASTAQKDVVYGKGGDVELKLNLAGPKEGDGPFPGVVCIHGGGWKRGNREQLDGLMENLARKGFVAATISYRFTDVAKFPAQIEDCKAAVRWLRANAKEHRLDPDRIGAMGFSAGGHLASMLGTSDAKDGLEGKGGNPDQSSRVQAVVNFFGPTDFTVKDWTDDAEKRFFVPLCGGSFEDKKAEYRQASPITYATKDDPPYLGFHGSEDKLVPVRHTNVMVDKLKSLDIDAKAIILEGEAHGWSGDKAAKTTEQTIEFFAEKLKKK